jgi:hypothetical protein
MNITRGKIPSAIKMLVYGPEGVGKTTFAAQTPGCVFIDTEGSTRHMDVARFDPPAELGDVLNCLNYVLGHPGEFGTVVIDTVDWMEKMLFTAVMTENNWKSIEDPGYGKGYVAAKEKMQQILELLEAIVRRGVNVCLVCHSMIRKFELPDQMGSYDRYMLKLNEKNIAPLVKEWVDLMLFVNYRTDIVTDSDGKTKKGKGGQKRIMYANHSASWDAKNRFGLPDEMPFDFGQIAHIFHAAKPVEPATDAPPLAEVPKDEKPLPDLKPPVLPGKVSTAERIPETPAKTAGKAKGKGKTEMARPDSMISDDPERDALLAQLWSMMQAAYLIDPMVIQAVCADRGYYDAKTPIRDYDTEFIDGCLIGAWDKVRSLAQTKANDLPF